MSEPQTTALLPDGLQDELPPDVEFEARLIGRLLGAFAGFGYQQVKPPLVEFERTFVEGRGGASGAETFRMVDPLSQGMLCVRPDITPQIARIACSLLAKAPRPLRLSYSGQILRVRGTQLRPERQFAQAGVELIGDGSLAADVEVVLLAGEALAGIGVTDLSIDLTLPTLVPVICQAMGLDEAAIRGARWALDRKDISSLDGIGRSGQGLFEGMIAATGQADVAIPRLQALDLPGAAREQVESLAELVRRLSAAAPDLVLTVDPGEFRGVEYHTGIAFAVFARGARGEICGGGRYRLSTGEPATGFSVYMEGLDRIVPREPEPARLFVPYGVTVEEVRGLRREGWRAIAGLAEAADVRAEARRLGCTHVLEDGQPQLLTE